MADARRALVVDDEASIRFVVSSALKERGWEVEVVDDGVAVEDALQNQRFDLIVLDLMMPGMNGFEVLRQMRSGAGAGWKTQPPVRVVALSGKTGDEGLEFARRMGADAVLGKPFEVEELWRAVEEQE
jgi:CheY-like chemotaxis protein